MRDHKYSRAVYQTVVRSFTYLTTFDDVGELRCYMFLNISV